MSWGGFMNYLSAIGLKREALLDRTQGACVQGELTTGGRALPERTEDCRVRTAHHRSVIKFSWVRRVGENNFRGFFEPTGEGSGQLVSWRHGGKGDVSRATCRSLRSVKDCVLCLRSCLASPQNSDKGWCFETKVQSQYINLTAVSKSIDRSCQHTLQHCNTHT